MGEKTDTLLFSLGSLPLTFLLRDPITFLPFRSLLLSKKFFSFYFLHDLSYLLRDVTVFFLMGGGQLDQFPPPPSFSFPLFTITLSLSFPITSISN